jgi:hypothetical protein
MTTVVLHRLGRMDEGLHRMLINELPKLENIPPIARMIDLVFLEQSPLHRCQVLNRASLGKL